MAAPKGNQNAAQKREWSSAIRKRAIQRGVIDKLADRLIDDALAGSPTAIKEFGDRFEGKAIQELNVGGQPDNPVVTRVELVPMMNGNSSN